VADRDDTARPRHQGNISAIFFESSMFCHFVRNMHVFPFCSNHACSAIVFESCRFCHFVRMQVSPLCLNHVCMFCHCVRNMHVLPSPLCSNYIALQIMYVLPFCSNHACFPILFESCMFCHCVLIMQVLPFCSNHVRFAILLEWCFAILF
jgi:hypothetical protein